MGVIVYRDDWGSGTSERIPQHMWLDGDYINTLHKLLCNDGVGVRVN